MMNHIASGDIVRRMKDARTETFEHTISGLLTKRRDMLTEAEGLRSRIAEIRNDLLALDRTLGAFGYKGDLDAMMPRQKRQVLFGRGDLLRAIIDELRTSDRPLRSREIAEAIVAVRGNDPRDQRLISEVTKRIGKALRPLCDSGEVASVMAGPGVRAWRLRRTQ